MEVSVWFSWTYVQSRSNFQSYDSEHLQWTKSGSLWNDSWIIKRIHRHRTAALWVDYADSVFACTGQENKLPVLSWTVAAKVFLLLGLKLCTSCMSWLIPPRDIAYWFCFLPSPLITREPLKWAGVMLPGVAEFSCAHSRTMTSVWKRNPYFSAGEWCKDSRDTRLCESPQGSVSYKTPLLAQTNPREARGRNPATGQPPSCILPELWKVQGEPFTSCRASQSDHEVYGEVNKWHVHHSLGFTASVQQTNASQIYVHLFLLVIP